MLDSSRAGLRGIVERIANKVLAQDRPTATTAAANVGRRSAATAAEHSASQQDNFANRGADALLANVLDCSNDAIVTIDAAQRVVLFSRAAERIFGCPAAEAIGKTIDRFIPARYHERHTLQVAAFLAAPSTGPTLHSIGNGIRSNGDEFLMEASIVHTTVQGQRFATVVLRDISEQERAKEKAALLAAIVESTSDAIISTDTNGLVTSWNEAATRLYGYEASEMLGRSIRHVLTPEQNALADERFGAIRAGERLALVEREAPRKDGSTVPISMSACPIRNARGEVIGVSAIARDITAIKQTEEALRRSEARFKSAFESLLEGCYLVGFDWRVLYVNKSACEMGNLVPEDIIGRHLSDVVQGLAELPIWAGLERCMSERCILRRENQFTFPTGRAAWFDVSVQPVPEGLLILFLDITERKQAELAQQESERHFRQIAQTLPQLIWTANAEGICDYISPQWGHYTGVPVEQQLGMGWTVFVHPDDLPRLLNEWNATLSGTPPGDFRTEFRLRRHDGMYRTFVVRATPLLDPQGRVVKWFGANSDVDEIRRGQEQQLRIQKLEALGTLAGGIAHDFNNILLAIHGNTRLGLADLPPSHPVRESLAEIDRAASRATELVRRILSFSRQEEPKREVVRLPTIVEEAVKLLRPSLPTMIELRTRSSENVPPIVADAGQLHQVVMNLGTNAAHAIGSGTGATEFEVDDFQATDSFAQMTPGLRTGRYARLTVRDTGCGMDKETLARIFDPFFTTKPVGQGTGLGLSVVAGIVKGHEGAITVYSEPGRGTAFYLFFPATAQTVSETRHAPDRRAAVHHERVLYVDDDDALVLLAERMLGRAGYSVTGCSDPREALTLFRERPQDFDVIVTDLSMPGMSGFDLTKAVLAVRSDIPVIITSGYVRPEDQEQARQLGAAAMILKPNTVEELGEALDRLFRARE